MTHLDHRPSGSVPLSVVLQALSYDEARERVSIGDLLAALGDRALGALIFVFAFPNALPMPPGVSAILGMPLVFLSLQLTFGRKPWLPAVVTRQAIVRADFQVLVRRIAPWLRRAERLLKPRAAVLALPPMEYLIGLICLVLSVVLVLPIPLGNILPALAISLLALGVVERDGLWIVAGMAAAAVSAVIVSGVVFALFKATIYFIDHVLA